MLLLRRRWRWYMTHRCTIPRVNSPEQSIKAPFLLMFVWNLGQLNRGTGLRGSGPSVCRCPVPPPSVGPASLARFVRDALVKWAIIPVGESDDDFWQEADPAPCQTISAAAISPAQTRTRGHVCDFTPQTSCSSLWRETGGRCWRRRGITVPTGA